MPTTIESLELEVQSSSTSATGGIDTLSASLSKLKNAVKGGVGLTSVTNQLKGLNAALQGIDATSAGKVDTLANSLSKLSGLGNIKISSSIGNQLQSIGTAATALNGVDFSGIGKLSTALQPLASLGKSNLTSFITQLSKLPQLAQTLNAMNIPQFASQLNQLSSALAPLASQLNTVSTAFSRLPTNIRQTVTATNAMVAANNTAAKSYVNLWAKLRMAKTAVLSVAHVIASWLTESNAYIENMNLFTVSMGEYAESASKYAEQVGNAMGIDPGEWMRNQGTFMTLIKGFGVAGDKANIMSQNLTQLAYDLASFENRPFEESMQKVQSGIAGELEPLRRWGYDLSIARLQQEALRLGIDKSVSSMTQAEKAQLRYYAIMTQVTWVQGDMARTLSAPANQLRILQAQLQQCSRAMGNLFLPIIQKVLPYLIAFAKVLREIIVMIASVFNISLPEFDNSSLSAGSSAIGDLADNADNASGGLGNVSDGLGNAAKEAKKLKNALLGIDELNVISENDDSGGSGSGSGSGGGAGGGIGGGGGLDFDLPTYDFLSGLVSSKVDDIVKMIKESMSEITAVISGFLLAIGTILVVTGSNIPLGLGLMAVGAVGLAASVMANWNGMSERLAKVLTLVTGVLGGFLLAIGAFLVFSGVNVPLGAGLMVAGAAALGTAAVINWKFLNGDLSNALSILTAIVSGALLAMGALFAFTGVDVPLGIALMAAGAVGMVTANGLNWDSMSDPLRRTIGMLETIVGGALLTFGAILALTGVNAPLGVAMIAAGAVSVASAVALNWNSLTGNVQESVLSIVAIMSGALIGVGAILALTGVNAPLGVAMIAAGAVGLAATVGLNWNSMPDSIKKVITKILIMAGAASIAIGMILAFTGVATPLGVGLILAGAAALGTAVALNWGTIGEKIEGVFTKIKSMAGTLGIMAIGLILCLTGVGIPLGIALIAKGAKDLATGKGVDWDTMNEKIGSGLKAISDKFGEFKGWVSEKLDGTKETIQTWASNTKEWFTKGKDGKGIIDHFKDTGAKVVSGFLDKVEEKYPGTKSKLAEWGSKTKEWFTKGEDGKGLVENFKETAGNIVSGFKDKIGSTYPNAKTNVTTWAAKAKEWFSSSAFGGVNSTTFSTFANNTIEGFKTKIGTAYTNTKTNVTTWASNVKDWFTNSSFGGVNNSNFQTFANNTIEGFKTKIGTAYGNTKSNITTWATKAKDWFTSPSFGGINSTSFSTFANNTIEGFKTKVGSAYINTKSNITTWASNVKRWFTDNGYGGVNNTNWQTFANNVVTGFRDKIGTAYRNTEYNITTWASNVKRWFSDIASNGAFSGFATNVIDGFRSRVGDYYTSAAGVMTTFADSVRSWFERPDGNTLASKFFDIGMNIIQGFIEGVNSLWDTAMRKIKNFGRSIISKGKEGTEERSPSRAFKRIGAFVVEGFNIGLNDTMGSSFSLMDTWTNGITAYSPTVGLSVDTSALKYYDSADYARTISANVSASSNNQLFVDESAMKEVMKEAVLQALNDSNLATDMRRQADKEEQTIVQVGNRTVTDAVTTQKKANGYVFAT